MAQIVSEIGSWGRAWHYGGGYSAYPTGTVSVSVRGTVTVHTGLSRVAAERAEIGIMDATPPFGPPPGRPYDPWLPSLHAQVINFTIGFAVHRGEMTGWWFAQVWA